MFIPTGTQVYVEDLGLEQTGFQVTIFVYMCVCSLFVYLSVSLSPTPSMVGFGNYMTMLPTIETILWDECRFWPM